MPLSIGLFGNPPSAKTQLSVNSVVTGSNRRPLPPVSLMSQPGNNCVLLTWRDQGATNCSVLISRDTESNVIAVLPPGSSQYIAVAVGGANPPVTAWYIAYRNQLGSASHAIQIKGRAAAQTDIATPPPNPAPPPGATPPNSGRSGVGFCFSGETPILAQSGAVAIKDIKVGDLILTGSGNYLPVAEVHRHEYSGWLHNMGAAGRVTPDHHVLSEGRWVRACELFPEREQFVGIVYNVTIATDEPLDEMRSTTTERSFVLAVNSIVVHNVLKQSMNGQI